MVGAHAGRRGLRRRPQLLPPRGCGPGGLRLRGAHPHPPGTGRRAHPQPDPHLRGRRRPGEHVLHDHQVPPGVRRRAVRRRHHRRGARPLLGPPLQGQHRPRQAAAGDRRGGGGPDPVHLGRDEREHGRGPADVDGQPGRGLRAVPSPRDPRHARRHPGPRERLVHQAAGGRLPGPERQGDPARDLLVLRRRHRVVQEGQPRQHRRVPRHARPRPRPQGPSPPRRLRGLHTYGGMSGRDMEALAQGIREMVETDDHVRPGSARSSTSGTTC
jgi:hypothetical protein